MTRVLIADDSGFLRGRLRQIVEEGGHEVQEAPDGIEALSSIESCQIDCVLLDLVMPRASGFEVLRTLQERGNETPVIVLTSDIQAGVKEECMELGATHFMNKPPRPRELLQAIDEAMASRVADR